MNELVVFDYNIVSKEQEMKLRIISERIIIRVQRTAEEMLAMGADLIEAKSICKEDGSLFSAWCESEQCPVGFNTAQRLMSVQRELGGKNSDVAVFHSSFNVLATISQTRESDIKQALLEHIEKEADEGKKTTQKEINLLKKSLKESKAIIEAKEDIIFDADVELQKILKDLKDSKQQAADAEHKRKKLMDNANEEYKKRKELEKQIAGLKEEIDGLDEEFEADLKVREQEIKEDLAKQPLTYAQVEDKKAQLKAIEKKRSDLQVKINVKEQELIDVTKNFNESKLREKALNEFNKGALNYRETILLLISGCDEMKNVPITQEMHESLSNLIQLTNKALETLNEVISIKDI